MNNRKYIGILIIIVGLIAFAGFIYFMFFYNFSSGNLTQKKKNTAAPITATSGLPAEQSSENSAQRAIINVKKQNQFEKKITGNDLKRLAASFVERFGSYSNQANYGNIRDLKIFMSVKMKKWADRFIKEEADKNTDSGIYYGIMTKAAAAQVNRFDNDSGLAEIMVNTQRRKAAGAPNNTVSFQQNIIVNFIKENGVWKVDSAVWQKR